MEPLRQASCSFSILEDNSSSTHFLIDLGCTPSHGYPVHPGSPETVTAWELDIWTLVTNGYIVNLKWHRGYALLFFNVMSRNLMSQDQIANFDPE